MTTTSQHNSELCALCQTLKSATEDLTTCRRKGYKGHIRSAKDVGASDKVRHIELSWSEQKLYVHQHCRDSLKLEQNNISRKRSHTKSGTAILSLYIRPRVDPTFYSVILLVQSRVKIRPFHLDVIAHNSIVEINIKY